MGKFVTELYLRSHKVTKKEVGQVEEHEVLKKVLRRKKAQKLYFER